MFSVIIPLYNKAPYVEKALKSVLNQTYQEFEVIVVDDGSTDKSLEIVEHFNKSVGQRLNIVSQKNQGVSTARNNGVKLAKNPYICFLDADDWWASTFLEEMKALIEAYPEAGIYGSSYFKVKNAQIIPANIGVEKGFERGLINYCKVYAKTLWMPLTSISIVIPKRVYEEESGFKPQLKLGEDFDLWVRIAMKYEVAFINKPLAYYNQDVVQENRAVGAKFYKPEEHMLFSDYGDLMNNEEFKFLFECLALYGLLPYYLNNINKLEVQTIIRNIDWKKHKKKYFFYYKLIPRFVLKMWFVLLRLLSKLKHIK